MKALAGFTDVKTVLSSGNVVFDVRARSDTALAHDVEAAMVKQLGRVFYTIVRPARALRELIQADPYAGFRLPQRAKRVVTFLREPHKAKLSLGVKKTCQERPMPILREWRGVIRETERDAYVAYIRGTGIADYRNTPGNLGALMAVNNLDAERTEVVTLSLWSSWDAIRAFAGESPELARYYPEDDRFLLERPRTVKHYEAFGELSGAQAT